MAYLAYARRFRPQKFSDVVGQSGVVATLRNAVTQDRVSHAYLFCGPRGVGKTTSARILARSLNCESPAEGEPCGECAQCRMIVGGESLDVVEMDAASHRGVDDIRNLREGVYNTTHGARFRVYIIDEVHMLTTEAFNAFLKILEEPPSHVKFVLCTTDPQRIPETVRSRCQRLDFRRVTIPDAVGRLRSIADIEGLTVEDEALREVALHARGGLRDAEVLLEQLAIYASGPIASSHVRELTGAVEESKLADLAAHLAGGNAAGAFTSADAMLEAGTDPVELMDAFLEHMRSALAVQACGADSPAVRARGIDVDAANRTAGSLTQEELLYAAAIVQAARKESRNAMKPRILLELALMRLSRIKDMISLEQLAVQVESGSVAVAQVAGDVAPSPAPAESAPAPAPVAAPVASPPERREPVREAPAAPPAPRATPAVAEQPASEAGQSGLSIERVKDNWARVQAAAVELSMPVGAFLKEGLPVSVEGDAIHVGFSARHSFHRESLSAPERLAFAEKAAAQVFGRKVRIKLVARQGESVRAVEKPVVKSEGADEIVRKSEGIRKLVEKSGGRIVHIESDEDRK